MRVVVIGGPNWAGISTFAAEYLGGEGEGPPIRQRRRHGSRSEPRRSRRDRGAGLQDHSGANGLTRSRRRGPRDVADEWFVYDNSGRTPVLMARSPGWRGVRESRAGRYAASETTTSRRSTIAMETPRTAWHSRRIVEGRTQVKRRGVAGGDGHGTKIVEEIDLVAVTTDTEALARAWADRVHSAGRREEYPDGH